MKFMSDGIIEAIQEFFERHGGSVCAFVVVLVALLVIVVVAMVYSGCQKGSNANDDTVTR